MPEFVNDTHDPVEIARQLAVCIVSVSTDPRLMDLPELVQDVADIGIGHSRDGIKAAIDNKEIIIQELGQYPGDDTAYYFNKTNDTAHNLVAHDLIPRRTSPLPRDALIAIVRQKNISDGERRRLIDKILNS